MSRRHSAEKREILPDPKFGNVVVTYFVAGSGDAGAHKDPVNKCLGGEAEPVPGFELPFDPNVPFK